MSMPYGEEALPAPVAPVLPVAPPAYTPPEGSYDDEQEEVRNKGKNNPDAGPEPMVVLLLCLGLFMMCTIIFIPCGIPLVIGAAILWNNNRRPINYNHNSRRK